MNSKHVVSTVLVGAFILNIVERMSLVTSVIYSFHLFMYFTKITLENVSLVLMYLSSPICV